MNIWIVGGGSIGLLFAAKLHAAGEKVLLITRTTEQANAIENSGITLINAIPHHIDVRQVSIYPVTADKGNVQHSQNNHHHDQYQYVHHNGHNADIHYNQHDPHNAHDPHNQHNADIHHNRRNAHDPHNADPQHDRQTKLRRAAEFAVPIEVLIERYGHPDWIWLALKQTALDDRMLHFVQTIIRQVPQVRVLTLMNGIGHLERLSECVSEDQLYGAVVSEGAKRTSPTTVEHTGLGLTKVGAVGFQRHDDDRTADIHDDDDRTADIHDDDDRTADIHDDGDRTADIHDVGDRIKQNLKQLQNVLQYAGFQTDLSNRLINDIWVKLIINSVINPLTALLGIRNGELLQHAGLKTVMRQLFEEAYTVASHTGVHISDQEALWTMLVEVCSRTARNRSSMLQDLEAGKPTELMWINGAIVRIAHEAGIHVPTHEAIVHLLQAKEEIR